MGENEAASHAMRMQLAVISAVCAARLRLPLLQLPLLQLPLLLLLQLATH